MRLPSPLRTPEHLRAFARQRWIGWHQEVLRPVSQALMDPERWPQALVEIEKSERGLDVWNFTRVLAPDASSSAGTFIGNIQETRKRAYSSWDLLLWTRDLTWLRKDPAFQTYLRDTGMLDYWRKHGFPIQCKPDGDGASCD